MKKTTALNKTRRKSNIMRDPFLNFYIWFGAHIRTGPKRTDKISRRNRKQLLRGRLVHASLSLWYYNIRESATVYICVWLGRPHRIAHTQLWRIILCNLGCKLSPKSGSWVRSAAAAGAGRVACLRLHRLPFLSLSALRYLTIANIRDSISLYCIIPLRVSFCH
jgi:hypothetical protein